MSELKTPGRTAQVVLFAATLCYLAGTATTVGDIVARTLFGRSVPGAIELTTLLIALGAMISMPACYAYRGHVTAKLLSELSPRRFARPLGVLGAFVSLVFAVVLFGMQALNLSEKIGSPQVTNDLALPVWKLLLVVVVALGLAVLAAGSALYRSFSMRGGDHG